MNPHNISYSKDQWTIKETKFDAHTLGKSEVIMAQGNGYMGLRAVSEENYFNETRNFFIAGTFNKAFDNEVTELPNLPDLTQIKLLLNGEVYNLNRGKILKYEKTLNLKTGELARHITWYSSETGTVRVVFRRMVSMKHLHLMVQTITVEPLEQAIDMVVISGINGQVTNSGVQHFIEGEKRFINKDTIVMDQITSESGIGVVTGTIHRCFINGEQMEIDPLILMDRRKIYAEMKVKVDMGSTFVLTKYSLVYTTRDIDCAKASVGDLRKRIVEELAMLSNFTFSQLLQESAEIWGTSLWNSRAIEINSDNPLDQVAARFAQYHLQIMMPSHDERMGIAAKGLTGEGYKGHSFWDTEIFIFPYFLYNQPTYAKQLLKYRYLTLDGARKKAIENHYLGAMFPWESAWLDDGEVTPIWGAADIVTGNATKIWSGFIEQHITADIAFAVHQYFSMTNDLSFMADYGYEILFETGIFWASRLEKGLDNLYHINNIIGPDEYKEHVDDNAFTNYLVELNFKLAIVFAIELIEKNNDTYKRLNSIHDLAIQIAIWKEKLEKLYVPIPNESDIIPQDTSYLQKTIIDLS